MREVHFRQEERYVQRASGRQEGQVFERQEAAQVTAVW